MSLLHGITLFSPSGALLEPTRLDTACNNLRALGLAVEIDTAALVRHQRFAGDDLERLQAIVRTCASPMRWAMAVRGGYGLSRLLPLLDFSAIARSGKQWVGHSDFTAFCAALWARTQTPSWIGPMASFDFGEADTDPFMRAQFASALTGQVDINFACETPLPAMRGLLWGGNLAMLVSLLGTPFWPRIDGGILYLEDINEPAYRIERLLLQLAQAGVLDAQQAVVLGDFADCKDSPSDGGYGLKDAVAAVQTRTKTPILSGLPFGHVRRKATLPFGVSGELICYDGTARLRAQVPIQ